MQIFQQKLILAPYNYGMKGILSLLLFLHLITTPTPPVSTHNVCVDPGHGGEDPGAINQDITEAQETLDIGQKLQALLTANGYNVIMTRTDNNTTLSNSQRADICNGGHADILIAIHLNANGDPTYDGTQGLYGTGTENKDKRFADSIHQILVNRLSLSDEGTIDFDDNLMIKAHMPATLQEVGYISSETEYQQLKDGTEHRQQEIAQTLFEGIVRWFATNK